MPEPVDGHDAALLHEAGRVVGDMKEMVDAGLYAGARFGGHGWLEVGDATRMLVLDATLWPVGADAEDAGEASAVCLGLVGGRFLKVRVTSPSAAATRSHALGFSAALAGALGLAITATGPGGRA